VYYERRERWTALPPEWRDVEEEVRKRRRV